MINITGINAVVALVLIVFSIFGGGVGAFFIIRKQLLNVSQTALAVTQTELKVYKDKVDRMQSDINNMGDKLKLLTQENLSLITERDYLKGLIISAITSKKDIHKEILEELKNSTSETKLYRDGQEGVESK